jgi:hypothetical protein
MGSISRFVKFGSKVEIGPMKSDIDPIEKHRGWLQEQGPLTLYVAMTVVSIVGLIYVFLR